MKDIMSVQILPRNLFFLLGLAGLKVQEKDSAMQRIAKVMAQISINTVYHSMYMENMHFHAISAEGVLLAKEVHAFKAGGGKELGNVFSSLAATAVVVGENIFFHKNPEHYVKLAQGVIVYGAIKSIFDGFPQNSVIKKINNLIKRKKEENKRPHPAPPSKRLATKIAQSEIRKLFKSTNRARNTALKKGLEKDAILKKTDEKKTVSEVIATTPKVKTQNQPKNPRKK